MSTNSGPPVITLTNAIPYLRTATPANSLDYYHFVVSSNSARAQFEVDQPSGSVTLVARRNLPLPSLAVYDYISQNAYSTNNQLIVVLTNSTPVALAPGDWYLAVVNGSIAPVAYTVKATEWATTGQPITFSGVQYVTNSVCFTWSSLPGAYYYLQGAANVSGTNWVAASPTILALTNSTTWCVSLPSPYAFFRIAEGLVPVAATPPIINADWTTNGFLLTWLGPVTANYQVQWKTSLPAITWNTFTNILTSTNDQFSFLDNGSQTGGLGLTRFYRVIVVP